MFAQTSRSNKAPRRRQIALVLNSEAMVTVAVFLSSREASKALGLPSGALDRARVNGNLVGETPPVYLKTGAYYRYEVKELNLWREKFKKKHQK